MKHFILLCCSLLASLYGFAWTLSGTITDSEGTPVAYARVYAKGTSYGAISQEDGRFAFKLPAGDYEVQASHGAYEAYRTSVSIETDLTMDIVLISRVRSLDSVQIEAGKKDPAYAIMKQLIEHKQSYKQQFTTYKVETYHKNTLKVDTLPTRTDPDSVGIRSGMGAFVEARSTVYFQFPQQYKTVVNAYHNSTPKGGDGVTVSFGDDGGDDITEFGNRYLYYQEVSEADFNFYDNLLQVPGLTDRPLVSPLHSTLWQATYRYRLDSTYLQDGKVHYRITVMPRNKQGANVAGTLIVVDGVWAIRAIDMDISPSILSLFQSFHIDHRYVSNGDGRWLLEAETYTYKIKEGRRRYKGLAQVVYEGYELDIALPNRFFRNETRRMNRDALDQGEAYWIENRPIALEEREAVFSRKQDSIVTYHNSPEYLKEIDSTYNRVTVMDILFQGVGWRNRAAGMAYRLNALTEQVVPLGVGGYRHNLRFSVQKTWKKGNAVRISPNLNYGFNNQDLKGGLAVYHRYDPFRNGRYFVRAANRYVMINEWATLATIFSRGNYINKVSFGAGHSIEVANGVQISTNFDYADYRAIDQLELAAWSQELFGENNAPDPFNTFRQFQVEFQLRITPFQQYQTLPYRKLITGSKWPTLIFKYKKAIPNVLQSEIDYDYIGLDIKQALSLGSFGVANWAVSMGTFLNQRNLRFTDYNFFRGSDTYLMVAPLTEFQLLGPTLSTPNEYFEGHYLHDFQGTIIDRIPLLNYLPLMVTAGAGTLYIRDQDFSHSEVFVGLNVPFNLWKQRMRLGVFYVASYTNNEQALASGFKVGFSFYDYRKRRWEF